jgi:hypothetical protein
MRILLNSISNRRQTQNCGKKQVSADQHICYRLACHRTPRKEEENPDSSSKDQNPKNPIPIPAKQQSLLSLMLKKMLLNLLQKRKTPYDDPKNLDNGKKRSTGKTYNQELLETSCASEDERTQFLKLLDDDSRLGDEQILGM